MDCCDLGYVSKPPAKMSLLRFIYHVPVGTPTYLDLLPVDVLRHHLLPFLGWEDRIHINRMTPSGDRTPPNKIPKDRIIAHHLSMVLPRLAVKVKTAHDLHMRRVRRIARQPPLERVVNAIIDVFREIVKNHNMMVVQHSAKLRTTVLEKVAEFSEPASIRAIPRLAQRAEMKDAIHHVLVELERYPAKHEVKPWKWGRAQVTQTESAILYEEWGSQGFVRRRQGDIFTVWE